MGSLLCFCFGLHALYGWTPPSHRWNMLGEK